MSVTQESKVKVIAITGASSGIGEATARALVANPRILSLDEATANVDSYTERLIQDALKELLRGRTAIIIAHRLSTIAQLDRILVLDQGRIAEQGSHDALLQQGGLYAQFWARQSGGFLNAEAEEQC